MCKPAIIGSYSGVGYHFGRELLDTAGFNNGTMFGSAHPGDCNMLLCDESARLISYEISPKIHSQLGNRDDGETIDKSRM